MKEVHKVNELGRLRLVVTDEDSQDSRPPQCAMTRATDLYRVGAEVIHSLSHVLTSRRCELLKCEGRASSASSRRSSRGGEVPDA